jgi:uncharacterized protein
MKISTTYFETTGKGNTAEALTMARERAIELGVSKVILASSHGYTALEAARVFQGTGISLTAVSISPSFADLGWSMTADEKSMVESAGVKVLTGLHGLADGVAEGYFGENSPGTVMADTLRCFSQGMKVAVEIAVMAAEAGLVETDERIIAIAGTDYGCDTAIVIRPAYARKIKDVRILELICKPYEA